MYAKKISYGDSFEVRLYEREPYFGSRVSRRSVASNGVLPCVVVRGEDSSPAREPRARRADNARRASVVFRRIVAANLGEFACPVLASLTYAENMQDVRRGRKDFNRFARALRACFGGAVRYVAVPEFQTRGALHFHALIWGIPSGVVEAERDTRLVAGMWGHGFIDLKNTDGSPRLASYLAKYLYKDYANPKLAGIRSFVVSRNCARPVEESRVCYDGYNVFGCEISTGSLLREYKYQSQYLGQVAVSFYQSPQLVPAVETKTNHMRVIFTAIDTFKSKAGEPYVKFSYVSPNGEAGSFLTTPDKVKAFGIDDAAELVATRKALHDALSTLPSVDVEFNATGRVVGITR